ncbi:putative peptidylprolyl isomerase [Helianthus annuus]|nr:putative peptidylprolyl isomerase [Helianthus annuus]KAJ0653499.1 putative peptidylprolyl isomerase [Helianthus annuus]KAJ0845974.1 putative peptidylprolyl isomerase [Helianthus annuus]
MAFWGVELKPGKPYLHQYDDERGRLHLSQATLGSGKSKEKAVVVCSVGDKKPIYLCSLLPRKMETCSLNIEFEEYDEVTFSVEGSHNIHLSGFFYGEKPDSDGDDYESDSDEDGSFEGAEIGSEDDSEFDFDDADDLDDLTDDEMVPNSGVKIEEIVEDEKQNANAVSEQSKKRNKSASKSDEKSSQQTVLKNSSSVPVLESEDEDGFPISSSAKGKDSVSSGTKNTEGSAKKIAKKPSEKSAKRKRDDSVVDDDDLTSKPTSVEASTPEVNVKKEKKKNKKNKKAKDTLEGANNNTNGVKEEANQEQTPEKAASVAKDKKNKKQESTPGSKVTESASAEAKPTQVRTFPNGLVIEELQMGKPNGKRATPGKKVSMRYIGKLKKNGKIFDSNIGNAPFKFRLGVGQVIAGWDVGVKGMRVGDKRRLTIPPVMGYGAKGAGPDIPPNSWLVFDVELVDVN